MVEHDERGRSESTQTESTQITYYGVRTRDFCIGLLMAGAILVGFFVLLIFFPMQPPTDT